MNTIAVELPMGLKSQLESYERQLILSALERAAGHQRAAAAALGILPTTLHEKMTRLGIPTARARSQVGGYGTMHPAAPFGLPPRSAGE